MVGIIEKYKAFYIFKSFLPLHPFVSLGLQV